MSKTRLVYYVNQFFGGIGGEEFAGHLFEVKDGSVGPGTLLEKILGNEYKIEHTIICGDNEFNEHEAENINKLLEVIEKLKPDIFVAGPAFTSGRYGLACMKASVAVSEKLGIPCITGIHPENPGAGLQDKHLHVYAVPVGKSAATMKDAIEKYAGLISKIVAEGEDHLTVNDGFLSRGIRKNVKVEHGAPHRAYEILLQKIKSLPFKSEIEAEQYEMIVPPQAIKELSKAKIALVTEAGLVPEGNPDGIQAARADKWAKYSIKELNDFKEGSFHSIHGGYDSQWVDKDPDRVLPLDALSYFVQNNEVGQVGENIYVTCGSMGHVSTMEEIGKAIAEHLLKEEVDGVILTAT
ncbi:MAG: glycine/betaine/sarcosine/D-proline family reductase selenoprotein B [Dehalobacterium sp.]